MSTSAAAQPLEVRIARYRSYLEHDPRNDELLVALGDLHRDSGAFDSALECYRRCLEHHPGHVAAQGHMANALIALHRFEEAQPLLEALCAAHPGEPAFRFNLGLALYYQRRWSDALAAFDEARELGLGHGDLLRHRAGALHHLGRLDEAIDACNAWLERETSGAAEAYLAVLEMDKGDLAAARQRAEAVLARNPDDTDAALVAGMCLIERQEVERAQRHFERLLALEPDNARGWFGIGLVHMHRLQHAQAVAALERALAVAPDHAGTLVTLGWARFTARDIVGAEQVFRRAIAADRGFGEAHGALAMALLFQNRRSEARREAALARRLNPQGYGAAWAHGALLALDGRREQGEAEVAAMLNRRVTSDGRTLFEHVQTFVRTQAARGQAKGAEPLPPPDRKP